MILFYIAFGFLFIIGIISFVDSFFDKRSGNLTTKVDGSNVPSVVTEQIVPGDNYLNISEQPDFVLEDDRVWEKVNPMRRFFSNKPENEFFCQTDKKDFFVLVVNFSEKGGFVENVLLPPRDLKGWYRNRINFVEPVKVKTGLVYKISMVLGDGDTRSSLVKVEKGGNLFVLKQN